MRRKDREKSREFALEVTDKCEWAVLSMTDQEGMPYAVPAVSYTHLDVYKRQIQICVQFQEHLVKCGTKLFRFQTSAAVYSSRSF